MSGFIQVKNFERFQHYKDRDPPWIKLYVRVLDDYAFSRLDDVQKAHLTLIWILASKMENKIPSDAAWIASRIGATNPVNLNALLESGFLEEWDAKTPVGKREEWSSRYVSAQTRADLLSLAQHMCAVCRSQKDLEIDHIVPISKGGTGDPKNLQVLCRKCNRKKRAKLRQEAAEHVRSGPLRRTTDRRSLETETETETEENQPTGVGLTVVQNGKPQKARTLEAVQSRLAAFLERAAAEGMARVRADEKRRVQAELVFAYWASKMDHPKALLDTDRERRLVKRLEENGGDCHELLYVVDGALKDDWTMGRTPRSNKRFDGIETIYQDRAHVEKFAALCPAYKKAEPHPMAVKYLESAGAAKEGVA